MKQNMAAKKEHNWDTEAQQMPFQSRRQVIYRIAFRCKNMGEEK